MNTKIHLACDAEKVVCATMTGPELVAWLGQERTDEELVAGWVSLCSFDHSNRTQHTSEIVGPISARIVQASQALRKRTS